jgi:hypothetical protein
VASVLGRALLWSFFDAETKLGIPQGLKQRLHFRFAMGGFEEDTNPIGKTEVVVYSAGTTLHIDPVARALGEDGNLVVNATNIPVVPNNQAVLAQSNTIRSQVSEVLTMMRTQQEALQREIIS